jgi:hypothetical protein
MVAFPTMKQGKRLLLAESLKRLRSLQIYFPSLLRIRVNNQEEIRCANGGRIITLTTNKEAKSNEGYSAALIVIDESHIPDASIFDEIFPSTFAQETSVKILLMGIGGYRNSLISTMSRRGFATLKVTGEYIASVFKPYAEMLLKAKTHLSEDGYKSNIMCEDRVSGDKMMFESIPHSLDIRKIRAIKYAGIDVGKYRDETVVTILDSYPDGKEIIDYMTCKGDWKYQADLIHQFLTKHKVPDPYVMIERNAIGEALIEALSRYGSYNNFHITEQSKSYLIDAARYGFRNNQIAVVPEYYRNQLLELSMELKDNGKIEWDHSDYLSSLLMALANFAYA